MAKKNDREKKETVEKWKGRLCGECALCVPYMRFETLTVKDRLPTMGTCPYRKFKVLLSEKACNMFRPSKYLQK